MSQRRLALVCVTALAFGRRSEAFCGLRADGDDGGGGDGGGGGGGDFVTCLKAKAIATLDHVSRADSLPLTRSVTLVRDDTGRRQQRSDGDNRSPEAAHAVTERELRSKPDDVLDRMLYDKLVGIFSGRAVQIALPELTPDQLRMTLDEGRGKMKKTMGMMMTAAAMKAMMFIPLALGVLFLMAGKAMIISKIALILSLIITLKKLVSKTSEHVVHETHTAASSWPSGGSSIGYGSGVGGGTSGGWDKRSSASAGAGHLLAYTSYKPLITG